MRQAAAIAETDVDPKEKMTARTTKTVNRRTKYPAQKRDRMACNLSITVELETAKARDRKGMTISRA